MYQTICGPADTLFIVCIFFCFLFLCITLVYWASGNDTRDIIINATFFIIFAVASVCFYNAMDSEWNYKATVNKEAERQIQEERKEFNIREQNFQKDVAARKAEILEEEARKQAPIDSLNVYDRKNQ